MPSFISHEPAVLIGLVATILAAVVASNAIALSPDTQKAILAAIPVVAGILIRFFVTPTSSLPAPTPPAP